MAKDIGGGARIRMGDAAAPMNTTNGGAADNGDLDELTDNLTEQSLTQAMETVDVTTLKVDANGFARSFIAALISNATNGNWLEDDVATMAFFKRCFDIRKGTNHVLGRGKVDMNIRPNGDGAGKAQLDFTILITQLDLNINFGALGGTFNTQIDGEVAFSLQ